MMKITKIKHIIPIPEDNKNTTQTIFQGFSFLLVKEYIELLESIAEAPRDILDVFISQKKLAAYRILNPSSEIFLLNAKFIPKEFLNNNQITIFWSTKSTYKLTCDLCSKSENNPIHITTKIHTPHFHISAIKDGSLNQHLASRAKEWLLNDAPPAIAELIASPPAPDNLGELTFKASQHNCNRPLLSLLKTYGYNLEIKDAILPAPETDQHIDEITKATTEIDAIIKKLNIPTHNFKNNAIIYCPAIYTYLYNLEYKLWKNIFRETSNSDRNFLKQFLIKNKGYSNGGLQTREDNYRPGNTILQMMEIRVLELNLFTQLISIIANSQFIPAIRLPHSVMLHHDILNQIAQTIKSSGKKTVENLNKHMLQYNQLLRSEIGETILNISFRDREKILAVCDFPLEWMSIDQTPLMFTHEISRIGSTPGNLLASRATTNVEIKLPASEIQNILILRSFGESDPIRNHLKHGIETFSKNKGLDNIKLRWVDIKSKKELTDELNNFNGNILIFDCHGDHGGTTENAWLQIGEDKINIWNLAGCKFPPIVILSACSTHPVNGSHASVANGLMRCGVVSVLGTYAPIDALHASVFASRLLFRISNYLPIAVKHGPISWRKIVSDFFKMSYATDVLRGMESLGLITKDQCHRINLEANKLINPLTSKWADKFFEKICTESNLNREQLKEIISKKFQFVDTMLYTQLGQPENIIFYKE